MKSYNKSNFFKHTFCEFVKVENDIFNENKMHFKSKSGSNYYYTKEGVYRHSNHWGRVANCRWRLLSDQKIKSQDYYVGFANWSDFYPLNEKEKQFYISVDFNTNEVIIKHRKNKEKVFLFFAETAQKRVLDIKKILLQDKWAKYYETDIETLRTYIVNELVNSNRTLQEIKLSYQ